MRIKTEQSAETEYFTNGLHDALMKKSGREFSMFGNPNLKLPIVAMFLSMAFLMGELFRTPSSNILKKCAPLTVTVSIEIQN